MHTKRFNTFLKILVKSRVDANPAGFIIIKILLDKRNTLFILFIFTDTNINSNIWIILIKLD
jgi:hypothetical protein